MLPNNTIRTPEKATDAEHASRLLSRTVEQVDRLVVEAFRFGNDITALTDAIKGLNEIVAVYREQADYWHTEAEFWRAKCAENGGVQ